MRHYNNLVSPQLNMTEREIDSVRTRECKEDNVTTREDVMIASMMNAEPKHQSTSCMHRETSTFKGRERGISVRQRKK